MIYIELLLLNGEIVRIECSRKFEDALYETIENTMKRGDWLCRARFDGCIFTYMGIHIDRVNMRQVAAML